MISLRLLQEQNAEDKESNHCKSANDPTDDCADIVLEVVEAGFTD